MKFRPTCFTIAYWSLVRYVSEPLRNKPNWYPLTIYKNLFYALIHPFDMD
jgi:hypothetical protein